MTSSTISARCPLRAPLARNGRLPRFRHATPPRLLLASLAVAAALSLCGCSSGAGQSAVDVPAPTAPPAPPPPPAPAPTPTPPAAAPNPFRQVVVLGDSVSAGFQNGSLLDTQQPNGWASLLAVQAGFSLTLPLIAPPGVPAVMELVSAGFPPVIHQASGVSTGRDNPNQQPTDFAVPGHKLHDLLTTQPVAQPVTSDQIITSLVLGYPAGTTGTQLQQAIAQQPSVVYLWVGGDDALTADTHGDPSYMTPLSSFSSDFAQLLTTLKANTTAQIFVANVPDCTEVPYMTPVAELLSDVETLTHLPAAVTSPLLEIYPGDELNPHGLEDLAANLTRMANFQLPVPLPPGDVLTAAEIAQVQAAIAAYNQVIAQDAAAAGATLVDVHSFIDALSANGITINGYNASTSYLGGLFGLDGIHPSNTGYALLANQFILSTNATLGTSVPAVDVGAVASQDPLFHPPGVSSTLPYARPHIPPAAGAAVTALLLSWEKER